MNPNMGSFGAALPNGGDPIAEAMSRRSQGDVGVTAQSSMSQTPMPQPLPGGQAPQSMGQPQPVQQPLPGESPATVDRNLILKALTNQLKSFDKMEELKLTGGM